MDIPQFVFLSINGFPFTIPTKHVKSETSPISVSYNQSAYYQTVAEGITGNPYNIYTRVKSSTLDLNMVFSTSDAFFSTYNLLKTAIETSINYTNYRNQSLKTGSLASTGITTDLDAFGLFNNQFGRFLESGVIYYGIWNYLPFGKITGVNFEKTSNSSDFSVSISITKFFIKQGWNQAKNVSNERVFNSLNEVEANK